MTDDPFFVGIGFVRKQCFIANAAAIIFFFTLQITSTCFDKPFENGKFITSRKHVILLIKPLHLFHFVIMRSTIRKASGSCNFVVFTWPLRMLLIYPVLSNYILELWKGGFRTRQGVQRTKRQNKRRTKGYVHGMCSWRHKEPKKEARESTKGDSWESWERHNWA